MRKKRTLQSCSTSSCCVTDDPESPALVQPIHKVAVALGSTVSDLTVVVTLEKRYCSYQLRVIWNRTMKRRWVWFNRQADQDDNIFSVLACLETLASVSIGLSLAVSYDWATWVLILSLIAPIFFLRSPESLESTKRYYERAVHRPHRFQLYGVLFALILYNFNAPFWAWVVLLAFGGLAFGHLYNAWYIQFNSTLAHIDKGIKQLPENYFRTLFVSDFTTKPEMFPGSGNVAAVPHLSHSLLYFPPPRNLWTFIVSANCTFALLGVMALRFVSKASAWLYLPLVFLSWPSRLQTDYKHQIIWIRSQSAKSIELFRFLLAVLIVLFFLGSILDATEVTNLLPVGSRENPLGTLIALYFVTDLNDVQPWHYISVINAALTITLYFMMDGCRKESIAGQTEFPRRLWLIIFGTRLRSLLSVFWILVVMFFTVEYYYLHCNFSGWLTHLPSFFLGEQACEAP